MKDQKSSVAEFLDAAAAKQPTPGGGSAAALAGALAAAMGEMVINYSVGKKGLEAHGEELKAALGQFHNARQLLLVLMAEDQLAYESLTVAKKLPPTASEREEAIKAASLASIRVPQAIAATGVSILELADKIVDSVNQYLLSDLAVCAELAMATMRCAIYNVKINLPEVSDQVQRWQIESSSAQILSRGVIGIQRVLPRIWGRIGRGE